MRVTLNVEESLFEMTLNAVDLEISEVKLETADGKVLADKVTYKPDLEQVVFAWPQVIAPGAAILSLRFAGALASDLRGFYLTKVNAGKQPILIAATQCEATDARRIFPCWDEPEFKARFGVSLVIDASLVALANGPELRSEPVGSDKRRVVFGDTMPMSTYLVALVVGPLEITKPVMADKVPIRIASRPGFSHLTDMAQEAAVGTLLFFSNYFGIPYAGDKLDHVAIPDFEAGAMENLGCVTYREELLLIDPDKASAQEKMHVVSVIAHETAHMWFGDLVTMRWWNGIWLNEAFATFMEHLATDALHPEWHIWTSFGHTRAQALAIDGLQATRPVEFPVGPPSEAWAMFDVLTYQKGNAILRMMEQYIGPEVFQKGIQHYLSKHRYGNTETNDLWDALEEVSGQPVRSVMDSWVFQGGYPLLEATLNKDGKTLELAQKPFRYQGHGEGEWQVPVVLSVGRRHDAPKSIHVLQAA